VVRRNRLDESIATIHRALDLGVTFIDTADIYGAGHNLAVLDPLGSQVVGARC
jgi:aryl-alcohol dehydrogenase-like predicted oxidoreductase